MPQLDQVIFIYEYFVLIFLLFCLYILFLFLFLFSVLRIIKLRNYEINRYKLKIKKFSLNNFLFFVSFRRLLFKCLNSLFSFVGNFMSIFVIFIYISDIFYFYIQTFLDFLFYIYNLYVYFLFKMNSCVNFYLDIKSNSKMTLRFRPAGRLTKLLKHVENY